MTIWTRARPLYHQSVAAILGIWAITVSAYCLFASPQTIRFPWALLAIMMPILSFFRWPFLKFFDSHRLPIVLSLPLVYIPFSYLILGQSALWVHDIWFLLGIVPLWHKSLGSVTLRTAPRVWIRGWLTALIFVASWGMVTLLHRWPDSNLFIPVITGLCYLPMILAVPRPTPPMPAPAPREGAPRNPVIKMEVLRSGFLSLSLTTVAFGIMLHLPFVPDSLSILTVLVLATGPVFLMGAGMKVRPRVFGYLTIGIIGIAVNLIPTLNAPILTAVFVVAGLALIAWWGTVSYAPESISLPLVRGLGAGILCLVGNRLGEILTLVSRAQVVMLLLFVAILAVPLTASIIRTPFLRRQNEVPETRVSSEPAQLPSLQTQMGETWLGHCGLTPQELKITLLLLQEYSNKDITATLYISINTLKTHLRNIYRKTDTANRRELLSRFHQGNPTPSSKASF